MIPGEYVVVVMKGRDVAQAAWQHEVLAVVQRLAWRDVKW